MVRRVRGEFAVAATGFNGYVPTGLTDTRLKSHSGFPFRIRTQEPLFDSLAFAYYRQAGWTHQQPCCPPRCATGGAGCGPRLRVPWPRPATRVGRALFGSVRPAAQAGRVDWDRRNNRSTTAWRRWAEGPTCTTGSSLSARPGRPGQARSKVCVARWVIHKVPAVNVRHRPRP